MKIWLVLAVFWLLWPVMAHAQKDLKSNPNWHGKNIHSGNKVRTTFYNYGMIGREIPEVGDYGCEWPINSGHVYVGDVSVLVGAEIMGYDDNDSLLTLHSVIVSDGPRDGDVPADGPSGDNNVFWGWEPIEYFAANDSIVAMSHMRESWPESWPDKSGDLTDPGWAGKWNGYFGKNVQNADQESFWKMDDDRDKEFQEGYRFYPDKFNPERGGLGLQMSVRGLQWSNPLAEDCIFWLYEVTNYGTTIYDKMVYGMIMGGIVGGTYEGGGDSNDDLADFYRDLNLTSSFDGDNRGDRGYTPVAYSGYAFLESPGNPFDGIDNDGDGAISEKGNGVGEEITRDHFVSRTLTPGTDIVLINYEDYTREVTTMGNEEVMVNYLQDTIRFYPGSTYMEIERNNIDDDLDGLIDETNGVALEDTTGEAPMYLGYLAKNWFTGDTSNLMIDERRDDGIDNDGDWNPDKDDSGIDGSFETIDQGQADGQPTSGAGTNLPGEPNIDKTDVDESDQIGLTSFYYFDNSSDPVRLRYDEDCWLAMRPGYFNIPNKNPIDGDFIYGTGYFPLYPNQTERLSLALLFGEDEADLIRNKNTVQEIYDNNYNFAKAPEIPTVRAYADDGVVTIYWDDAAERSVDVVTGYDFEGYKIYRTTDPSFLSNGVITDGHGTSKFSKPIAIYDKINGWKGFYPYGLDGVQFKLSDDVNHESGLRHSFTDSSVVNGKRYFYAVTSYDHGEVERRIPPSECSKYATIDENGEITTAKNVVAVVPGPRPIAYERADADELLSGDRVMPFNDVVGTGDVYLEIVKPDSVPDGRVYQIHFTDVAHDLIDNDFDWRSSVDIDSNGVIEPGIDAVLDDSGVDGDSSTNNEGFGNGVPDTGEPNIDENDQEEFIPYTSGYYIVDVTNGVDSPDTIKYVPFVEADPFKRMIYDTLVNVQQDGSLDTVIFQREENYVRTDTFLVSLDDTMIVEAPADTVVNRLVDIDVRDVFNGARISIKNDLVAVDSQIISEGFPDEYYTIQYRNMQFANIKPGIEYPRDYIVIFEENHVKDSDSLYLERTSDGKKILLPPKKVNFTVLDGLTMEPVQFAVYDATLGNDFVTNECGLTKGDKIVLFETSPDGTQIPTWAIVISGGFMPGVNVDSAAYATGDYIGAPTGEFQKDTLWLASKKPFRNGDIFQFTVHASKIGSAKESDLDKVTVVPNPYIVYSNYETFDYKFSKHSLKFMNLPSKCVIRIYNVNGYLVDTIEHESLENGIAEWDLLSSEGLDVAYGIYIYHIDAPGIGEKIGKFAVIK